MVRGYERLVGRPRAVVAPLPYWQVEERDGHADPVDAEHGRVLLRLDSMWNPTLGDFCHVADKGLLLGDHPAGGRAGRGRRLG